MPLCFAVILFTLANFPFFDSQYGNHIREGKFQGRSSPTYVFPTCLKEAVRERIDENLRDYPDPEGAAVSITFFCFVMLPSDSKKFSGII